MIVRLPVTSRLTKATFDRVEALLDRIKKRLGIGVSRASLIERLIERGLLVLEAEENRVLKGPPKPLCVVSLLSAKTLRIVRMPGCSFEVETEQHLPRLLTLPPSREEDEGSASLVGSLARVKEDDSLHEYVQPVRGKAHWRRLEPGAFLWNSPDREWAVVVVDHDLCGNRHRVQPYGFPASHELFAGREMEETGDSSVDLDEWNSPFVLATCASQSDAQAYVDALVEAASMFQAPRSYFREETLP